MSFLKTFLALALLIAATVLGRCADATGADAGQATAQEHGGEHAEGGLPEAAPTAFHLGPFPVSASMLVTWIVAILVILFARSAMKHAKMVPDGKQNLFEWLVESLYTFLESIIGRELTRKTFWFYITIFIFILFTNWFGLLPGVGTIGWGTPDANGALHHIKEPLFRGGNADLNMTFAMAAIFMVLWLFWSVRASGVTGFFLHIFGPKGDNVGFIKYFMIVVFFCVGFLEVVSIAFRPISLSFRLYGNIFAGENLLESLSNTIQHPAWAKAVFSALLPVPFYFLELLVGLVQAFVFMLLATVFTSLMCEHEEEHAKEPHH